LFGGVLAAIGYQPIQQFFPSAGGGNGFSPAHLPGRPFDRQWREQGGTDAFWIVSRWRGRMVYPHENSG
jgi:hypothetical protein